WWGLVTDTGEPCGNPIMQSKYDPYPGFYVSRTALMDEQYPITDPRRYVDASRVPYIVIPPELMIEPGAGPGDLACVRDPRTGRTAFAVVANVGERRTIGRGSIALARALGLDPRPRRGGASDGIATLLFPRSRIAWPL